MKTELVKAHVKYDDMLGSIAIDFRDMRPTSFDDLLREHGFDFDTYFPYAYGMRLWEATFEAFDLQKDGSFFVYAVSKEEIGADIDVIDSHARQNKGVIPTTVFYIEMPMQRLFEMFKRVEFMFTVRKRRQPGEEGHLIEHVDEIWLKE